MDFTAFKPPPSDHHPMNTGLSTENGVTAKGLIEGINAHFTNLYQVLKGGVSHVVETIDDEARTHLTALEDVVTSLQQKVEALTAAHTTLNNTVLAVAAGAQVAVGAQGTATAVGGGVKVDPPAAPVAGTTEHDQLLIAQARIAQLEAETAASTKTA
jgi:hypothetical protein